MSLILKEGDLLVNVKPPAVIVHGCNCQGRMGRGFAGQLRKKFPDAFKIYKTAEAAHGLKLGDINGYSDTDNYTIINALTQEWYGTAKNHVYVSYEAVEQAMNTVARWVMDKGGPDYPIHLPFIGAGNANGDREKLLGIFKEAFKDVTATLWLDQENARWARLKGELE